jgi:hypothetical protein
MAKILGEVNVGITEQISEALKIACDFSGLKPSQYCRQAVLCKLVAEGFMQHQMAVKQQNAAQ